MKYILDTCCISDFVKYDANTVKRLKQTAPTEIVISSVTVMELEYGLLHNPERAKKIRPLIQSFVSSVVVLPYTEEDAKCSANIRALMRKSGTPIGDYDVLIAGTALHHGLILVTANTKEFQRVSKLVIENWRD
jgi:tRNA(fMet)-specific endonuclease VapC